MKKAILYIIMLATTCVTVYITIVWEPINENEESKVAVMEEKEKTTEVAIEEKNTNEKTNANKVVEENSKKNTEKIEENSTVKDEAKQAIANVSLLKMDINDIVENISFVDKTKLVKIGYKLQNIDRKRVEEWVLNSSNKIDGARSAYNLLKSRLSSDDFKELEGIIEPYVNLELLK